MTLGLAGAMVAALAATVSAQDCVTPYDAAKAAGASGLIDVASRANDKLDGRWDRWLPLYYVTEKFPEDERITFFMPSDAAVKASLPEISGWTLDDQVILVVEDHVDYDRDLKEADIAKGVKDASPKPFNPAWGYYVTGNDADLFVTPSALGVPQGYSDIKAKIVKTDIETCAGTMHVINAVLINPDCQDGYCDVEFHEESGAYGGYGDDMGKGKKGGMPHHAHKDVMEKAKEMVMKHEAKKDPAGDAGKAAPEVYKASPEVAKKTAGTEVAKDSASAGSSTPSNSPSGSSSTGSGSSGATGSSSSSSSGSSSGGGLSGAAVGGIAAGAAAVGVAAIAAGVFMKGKFAAGAAAPSGALSV